MSDVRDILELDYPKTPEVNKDTIMGLKRDQSSLLKRKREKESMRRPEGMHRELFALLYSSDGPKDLPPLLPTDADKSYKSVKAKLGMKRVRPWEWMPFTNPARSDDAVFYHWRRSCDKGKEYPFSTFNKKIEILTYNDDEYSDFIGSGFSEKVSSVNWTRDETDTLFDLCNQFDLRWPVVHDRWSSSLPSRSMEELKGRYYDITNFLKKNRGFTGPEGKLMHYDADHEKRRKEQLIKLYDRTPEQIEEEQRLSGELRRIEARKKERERKTHDLQRLISASEAAAASESSNRRSSTSTNKPLKKKQTKTLAKTESAVWNAESCAGIKFPDTRASGVSARSHRMKLPASVGHKKVKAIEQLLHELGIDLSPMPVEAVCEKFNELRSDLVLMYDLRTVLLNFVFELQTLKHQHNGLNPAKQLQIPECLTVSASDDSPSRPRAISEVIDAVATPNTPNRKRRAALEQNNVLRKMKSRN